MAISIPSVTPLPTPPTTADPANFDPRADLFLPALVTLADELDGTISAMNAAGAAIDASAVAAEGAAEQAAASAATAVSSPGTASTSSTAHTLGTGQKAFVTQAGKAWVPGQAVVIARTSNPVRQRMVGIVVSYVADALVVEIQEGSVAGAGTFADWTISLTAAFRPPVGLRNRIINGAMKIDQRYRGAPHAVQGDAANMAYTVDRFYAFAGGSNLTGQQIAVAGQNRYRLTGAAGNVGWYIGQRIEAANSADLAGHLVAIQAKIACTSLDTIAWALYRANTTDAFGTPAAYTRTLIADGEFTGITAAESLCTAIVAVPANATTGLELQIRGTPLLGGQTFTIGDVQLEAGDVIHPFEQRLIGAELNLCQRYLPAFYMNTSAPVGNGVQVNSSFFLFNMPFPVPARVPPGRFVLSSPNAFTIVNAGAATASNATLSSVSQYGAEIALDVAGTPGAAAVVRATGVIAFRYEGAEL